MTYSPPTRRLLPLAPNLTEMAFAAGAGEQVVAVGPSDNFPPAVDSLPHVSVLPVDFESVVSLQPDLVLATTQVNATRDAETFDALDIPVYYFSFPTVESVFEGIRVLGTLAGTSRVATDSADALASAFGDIRRERAKTIRTASDRPRVLVLAGSDVLYSFGKDSYVHTLVDAAGGQSITADMDASAPTLSEEFVLTAEPDVIVGAFGDAPMPETLLDHHPAFDALPAVRNGQVYSISGDLIFRPGPRLVQGTRRLAQIIHSDRIVRSRRNTQ
ncbi:ABC transporter substrate-binding protein [Longibacter salinarum]|uniref:ABC transporter substrate-binding protein n=1 Tax=Longibacter salinarum TaxID=1850348 RepID=UPI0015CF0BA5|nr:helical backbone metal receptor [Longibacter salinarum]